MKENLPVLMILTPGFPENETDSTCLPFIQSLVRTINKDFSHVKLIVLSFQYPFVSKEYVWNNNRVISFGGRNRGKIARRILWFNVWRKMKMLNKENKITGIFSLWMGECAMLGSRFGRKFNIPHYCWIAGQDARPNNHFVSKIKPDHQDLIAISDSIADEFFKNYLIRPSHVIPNGIEKELYPRAASERTVDLLGAGSLIPLKQYEVFIQCVSELMKRLPDINAHLSGSGPETDSLRKRIIENKLQNNVLLHGELAHGNLLKLMQQSKVFLHPSSYEGFSMVCLEALYAGCQVISFCKPMDDDITNWHIVNNIEEMIEKAYEILSQPGFEYTSEMPYSINNTAKSIMKLYNV
ncbi:MAG: glycosyltransferase [Ginsengibacter sp.]